ncbi:hypothetical protein ACEWPM_016900 [Roseovarius sp. S4756]|uniref:hypothetical protein n=1 Tax=Roseovarius maritimus TaxID=3342637 RepID=UPI003726BDDF
MTKPIVLSVTKFNAGSVYNVVPDDVTIAGTIRYFHQDVIDIAEARMRELCAGMATAYGIEIEVDIRMTSSARSVPRFLASSLVACGLRQSKGIALIIADWICCDDHDTE